jgi:hypothetical protein
MKHLHFLLPLPNEIAPQRRAVTRQPHNTCMTSVQLTSQYLLKTPAAAGAG